MTLSKEDEEYYRDVLFEKIMCSLSEGRPIYGGFTDVAYNSIGLVVLNNFIKMFYSKVEPSGETRVVLLAHAPSQGCPEAALVEPHDDFLWLTKEQCEAIENYAHLTRI